MAADWLKDLNQEQKQAVTYGAGPLLILAGAGSGKTRALTYRAAYLIKEKGLDPTRILLVTFTNKAAKEMKDRVRKLIGKETALLPWMGTFHAFCARILRIDGQMIRINKQFVIYDEDDSLTTIKQAMKNLAIDSQIYKPRVIKAAISAAKNELIDHRKYDQLIKGNFAETIARVYREYQRLLKTYEALDFDDLLMQTVKLLQNSELVAKKYQEKYLQVLIDEYQDTNKAQYQLTKFLTKKWRNFTAVGDFSQSIYSFRGADFRNLNNLKNDFPDIEVISMEQNYRSTKNILAAANQVIAKNSSHPILKLWAENRDGPKIKTFEGADDKEELQFIVNSLAGLDYQETAILYRTNAQSRIIEEALIKAGIPYILVGGVKFYSRREIKDCLAYLRLIVNPKDKVSYERLQKLGKKQLEKFINWKPSPSGQTTRERLEGILKETKYLDRFDPKDEQDLARLENIKELMSVAEEYPDLEKFLENAALVEQQDVVEKKTKSVTLMTLHASKGLEFKNVFMVGMEEGLFPHSRSLIDREELEEERRLCYVGMTRAKENLFLSYSRKRLYFGSIANNTVSRFLGDIEESLLESINDY
ncbi:MAG: ATP-dependent DNA helicase UvrD/PcrA [Candidatus Beckwithbacteria bacterium GW2011_GWA2_43_10]|uniref:DNA 3'-5' helicase n=1 Tax=Candidatus Beckwithbacteria bacterium GW2011_GWA2_43_10 TaxID=1618369 RepID=A0A0G1F0M3_9BACT|nr:MAG: ATP-dependent DNA helicase UvrD/PcrA [Candidatus Beckwithbacteria bacterium GW2011_GWA2_43_10]